MPPRGGKIKRTKTFTGCSTCRSRGVKCGEEKPTCLRCKKVSLECGGYGVTLVWPGSNEPKASQRRVMLTGLESSVRAMSDEELTVVLNSFDTETPVENLTVGLFGVFPAATSSAISRATNKLHSPVENQTRSHDLTNQALDLATYRDDDHYLEIRNKTRLAALEMLKWRLGLTLLGHSLYNPLPIKCQEGRELMHYWVTHLGPLMIPTERLDNPFISIIVPLALDAVNEHQDTSGSNALLHSVYSLSAFSQSSSSALPISTRKKQYALGSACLQVAFEELSHSLVKGSRSAPEPVLATILMLVVIGIFTNTYSNYRIHIRGGVDWIRSIDKSTWKQNNYASTIYQLFTVLEALRPAHSILARDLGPQDLLFEDISINETEGNLSTHVLAGWKDPQVTRSETISYCLDKVFALTKPILECIMQINRFIFADVMPADGEFVSLEFKIMASNPELLPFPSLTPLSEKVARHHACSFWCALYVYFKSSLLKLPPSDMQWLVRQSMAHLDAVEWLTDGLTCSGFLWPLFITACEAEDENLRAQAIKLIERREKLGIANVAAARKVVDEVWRRRDQGANGVSWHEVMAQLNIDILLS